RRLGHEERAGDLGGREAAEQAQGERDPGGRGERGVTAGEDQPQPVVAHGALLRLRLALREPQRLGLAVVADRLAAQPVERLVAGRRDDPARGGGWHAVDGPAGDRRHERLLHALLGEVDVAERPHEHGDRAAVLLPEDLRDRHRNGCTSMGNVVASAKRRPQPSASSRSSASTTASPPRYSLPSRNGPSVSSTSSSWARTTVAVEGPASPPANTQEPLACRSAWISARSASMRASRSGGGRSPVLGW